MNNLPALVDDLLGPRGAFAASVPGWRASIEQIDYAQRLVTLLLERHSGRDQRCALAAVEAATGIGKSFGYLVPLLAYSHLTGRRVAVATHSLALLNDLHRHSVPLVNRIITAALKRPAELRTALRVGQPEYVSADRVYELHAAIPQGDQRRHALVALQNFALSSRDGKTSGRLRDWCEAGFSLPEGISANEVCITPWCAATDRSAIARATEQARQADVVLTTHAAVLMHCLRRLDLVAGQDDLPPIDAVVMDEADRVPSMAEAVAGSYVPIHALTSLLASMDNGRRPAVSAALQSMRTFEAELVSLVPGPEERIRILHGPLSIDVRRDVAAIATRIAEVIAKVRKIKCIQSDAETVSRVDAWRDQLRHFASVLENQGGQRAAYLKQSPVRGYAGLGVVAIDPGRVLAQLWRREVDDGGVRAMFLTSATLAPPGKHGMDGYYREVGVDPAQHRLLEDICGQIEPAQHGYLDIVLADPRAPRPFEASADGIKHNGGWLDYATGMIAQAHAAGGRTLVLCASYGDSQKLSCALRDNGMMPIQAARGSHAGDISAFLASDHAVWLTPCAWEGLDLPGAIQQLVIPRIPYPPLDGSRNAALREVLLGRGMDEELASRIALGASRGDVARKLRQGIGRALRRHDDRATLWIADPRFPLPKQAVADWVRRNRVAPPGGDKTLVNVIPARFRNQTVRVLGLDNAIWSAA